MTGSDSVGNRLDMVWSPDGGDIVTTNRQGARDVLWFSSKRVVHEHVDGGIDVIVGLSTVLLDLQSDRSYITWRPLPSGLGFRGLRLPASLETERGPGIATRWTTQHDWVQSFDPPREYAERGSFTADGPPVSVATFPPVPKLEWRSKSGLLEARVAGQRVRLLVDTATPGLRVSRRFATRIGAPHVIWQSLFFLRALPREYVRLDDVQLGTARVRHAFAALTDDDSADLFAGVNLFRGNAIAFARGQLARLSTRRCDAAHAVDAYVLLGAVFLDEIDRPAERRGSFRPDRRAFSTLLDTTYAGQATFFEGGPIPMTLAGRQEAASPGAAVKAGSAFVEAHGPRRAPRYNARCDVRGAIPIVISGHRFGSALPECEQRSPPIEGYVPYNYTARLGLDSLDAKTLLVDLQNNRVCWYN
jgi:hypothetical protein